MQPEPATVTQYLAAQPASSRASLRRVRATIRSALPRTRECIDYGVPTYRVGLQTVISFAGWTKHWSIYGATPALVEALGDALAPYDRWKQTIRFPLDEPPPLGLVARIARFRLREEVQRVLTEEEEQWLWDRWARRAR